jgi:hypothetical protein
MSTSKLRARNRLKRTVIHETKRGLRALRKLSNAVEAERTSPQPRRDLALAWHMERALSKSATAAHHILNRAPRHRPLTLQELSSRLREDPASRARAETLLRPSLGGRTHQVVQSLTEVLPNGIAQNKQPVHTVAELSRLASDWSGALRKTWREPPRQTADAGSGFDPHIDVSVCVDDKNRPGICFQPKNGDGTLLVLGALATAGLGAFFANIEDIFNGVEDDNARAAIAKMSTKDIIASSDATLRQLCFDLLDGPTGDDDENSLIKIVQALPADRVKKIVDHFGGVEEFMGEFQGDEYDTLALRLQEVGLMKFSEWDDEQAWRFAFATPPDKLARMSLHDIATLCRILMDGWCSGDDELAIVRLVRSQPDQRIVELVDKHLPLAELEDSLDGDEWDTVHALVVNARKALKHS